MEIELIGGVERIGASAALLKALGKTILIDCGADVPDGLSEEELARVPELDVRMVLKEKSIDLAIITHAHYDHVGDLLEVWQDHPQMRVRMTRPTLETARITLADTIRIGYKNETGEIAEEDRPLLEQEINLMEGFLSQVEIIPEPGYYTPFPKIPLKIGFFPADHIRGAMMVLLKVKENGIERKVLFTGDFGLEDKETTFGAPILEDYFGADLIFMDATNGAVELPPRPLRYTQLVNFVSETRKRGGRVLLPSLAIERSPEVLIHLIKQGFKTHLDGMGNQILKLYLSRKGRWCPSDRTLNPRNRAWRNFVPVRGTSTQRDSQRERLLGQKSWVVVASSATLKGGASAEYALKILEDEKSTIIFPSHIFENTPAHTLFYRRGEPVTLFTKTSPEGKPVNPVCRVEQVRLSAHLDKGDILRFIEAIQPKRVVPIHCGGKEAQETLLEELSRRGFTVIRARNGMTIVE